MSSTPLSSSSPSVNVSTPLPQIADPILPQPPGSKTSLRGLLHRAEFHERRGEIDAALRIILKAKRSDAADSFREVEQRVFARIRLGNSDGEESPVKRKEPVDVRVDRQKRARHQPPSFK